VSRVAARRKAERERPEGRTGGTQRWNPGWEDGKEVNKTSGIPMEARRLG
jgi:hypothetical protein